ncbi:MAG: nucleoside 2-deoxyribosyltransferase [Proteobacteria bacterium]|nr:nucleoside 2-deoxyribosyltransferase [Pseudomonadota bacterium]
MRIYLAAPLFNDMERSFNTRLTALLESFAEVFLPQRDGKLMRDLVAEGIPLATARIMVFEADLAALKACTHVVAVLDGRTIDEGVAFEVGYANALGKTCIGLKTDDRALLPSGDNPMILCGCQEVCMNIIELVDRLRSRSLVHRAVS